MAPNPTSERSLERYRNAHVLPADGHRGDPPAVPLPNVSEREQEVWQDAWRTPQAAAWAREHWRWPTVAMWVRWSVRMEDHDAPAAIGNVVLRLADQLGLTPAGLRENGWRIEEEASSPRASRPRSLTPVPNGGGSLERARNRFAAATPSDGDRGA